MKTITILLLMVFLLTPVMAFCCSSDFDCGIGHKCAKGSYQSTGVCVQVERSYGVPDVTRMPKTDSIYPNTNPPKAYQRCPIGYQWSYDLQICVR